MKRLNCGLKELNLLKKAEEKKKADEKKKAEEAKEKAKERRLAAIIRVKKEIYLLGGTPIAEFEVETEEPVKPPAPPIFVQLGRAVNLAIPLLACNERDIYIYLIYLFNAYLDIIITHFNILKFIKKTSIFIKRS